MNPPDASYIVIEGIDGAGKSTQAAMLAAALRDTGHTVQELHEPTAWYVAQKALIPPDQWDARTKLFYLLLDRHLNVVPLLKQARANGHTVIADRSYISTMVYQSDPADDYLTPDHIFALHRFMPQPDALILIEIDPQTAMQRIRARGSTLSEYETESQLARYAASYHHAASFFGKSDHGAIIVQADTLSADALHAQICARLNL